MDNDRQADDIRNEMARVRRDADANAVQVIHRARELTDWRFYVRNYPTVTLATASALGFLLVPSRSRRNEPRESGPDARAYAAAGAAPKMTSKLMETAAQFMLRNGLPWLAQEASRWWRHHSDSAERQAATPGRPHGQFE